MARDPRPYTSYPLNYTSHPRVESLSDAAFRAFHEMNDYSRIHGLDGLIPEPIARKRWSGDVLAELLEGIDDRPLVVMSDGGFLLRSYAEHQMTTAQVTALRLARAEAGRKGGQAKAHGKQTASEAVANASDSGKQILAQSQSQSQDYYSPSRDQSSSNRARVSTDPVIPPVTARMAARKGLRDLGAVIITIREHTGLSVDAPGAYNVATAICERAPTYPADATGYVATSLRNSAEQWRKYIFDNALEATS